jgi:hypothetical protein
VPWPRGSGSNTAASSSGASRPTPKAANWTRAGPESLAGSGLLDAVTYFEGKAGGE